MDNYFIAPERFEASEFVLRSYHPGDGPLLNEAVNNSLEHLRRFMPWAEQAHSQAQSEKFCRTARAHYLLAEDFTLGIFSPAGDRVLGGTGFHLRQHSGSAGVAEIGMWIRGEAAGKGLGTRALQAMLRWGFTEWPWQRLFWRCDVDNIASARTAEKAGLIKEGTIRGDIISADNRMRPTHYFGILRDEWLTQNE